MVEDFFVLLLSCRHRTSDSVVVVEGSRHSLQQMDQNFLFFFFCGLRETELLLFCVILK